MKHAFIAFSILLLCSACAPEKTPNNVLTVSIEPLRYVTEALAGDKYTVVTLTPKEANPETYSPTLQQIKGLTESVAYIRVGTLGFEKTQMRKITENCPHLYVVNASENTPVTTPCGNGHDHETDPHTWMSPQNMKIIALNICKALRHIDHSNADYYEANLTRFLEHTDSVSKEIQSRLNQQPHRTFLINHPSLGHYAAQFGMVQMSVEHNGKEASAEQMVLLTEQCKKNKVQAVLIQEQHSSRAAEAIAKELGITPSTINPLSYEWDKEILRITELLCP